MFVRCVSPPSVFRGKLTFVRCVSPPSRKALHGFFVIQLERKVPLGPCVRSDRESWRPAVQLSCSVGGTGLFGDLLKGCQMVVWAEGRGGGLGLATSQLQEDAQRLSEVVWLQ